MWKKIIRELKMLGNEALMEFLRKILPDETDEEKMEEKARKLAIRKPAQSDSGYLLIDPLENKGNGRYEKESIERSPQAPVAESEPYSTFRQMRILGKKAGLSSDWYLGDTETFLKQAKFMEDFSDDADKAYPLEAYYTTYDRMNDNQLRTYFTWRTKVRNSNVTDISVSYLFCYVYELLNGIGTKCAEETIEKLIYIWTEFRKYDDSIDGHFRTWIRDYYIVNHNELLQGFSYYRDLMPINYYGFEPRLYVEMMDFKWKSLKAVEIFSSFRITDGQFYKSGNQEIMEKCACFVLERLSQTLNEAETDIKKLFTAKQSEIIYSFFRGAVVKPSNFYEKTVELDGIETYKYNGRTRSIETPDVGKYKAIVGYILKLTEVNMRRLFGFKKNLKPPTINQVEKCFFNDKSDYGYYAGSHISKLSSWKRKMLEALYEDSFEETIIQAISDFIKEENIVIKNGKLEIIKPIEIDLSKIKDIERDHIETAKRLILEEDIERDEGQLSEIYNCKKNYRQQEINLINKAEVQSNNESGIKSNNDANAAKIPLSSINQISKIDEVHIVNGSYENESQSIGQLNIFDFAKETIIDEGNKPEIEANDYDNARLSGCQAVINVLSNEAKDLISHLANGEKAGSNYELLVEEINEKALEITGDNLIEYVSGEPQIYEDYLNEVKEAVGGR